MNRNHKPTPCQFDASNPRKHSAAFEFILPVLEEEAERSITGEFTITPTRLSKLSGGYRTGSISPDCAAGYVAFLVWIGTLELVRDCPPTYRFSHAYTVTAPRRKESNGLTALRLLYLKQASTM